MSTLSLQGAPDGYLTGRTTSSGLHVDASKWLSLRGWASPTDFDKRRFVLVVLLIVVALTLFRDIGRGDDHHGSVCVLNDGERNAAQQ
jgi:hypothetical protein